MKTFSSILLYCIFPVMLVAQNPYNAYYCERDSTSGKHTVYHANGKVAARYTVSNKSLQDTLYEYDIRGKLYSVASYKNGRFHGESYQLDSKGRLYTWVRFKNDTLLEAKFYSYYKNDTLHWLTHSVLIRFGVFPYEYYGREGLLQTKLNIPKYIKYAGARDSIIEKYENGNIKQIYHYVGSKAHGLHQKYAKEGWKTYEATYNRDKLHGEERYFDEKGNVTKRVFRKMGKKVK